MVQGRFVHRMGTGIDPGMGGDRTKLAQGGMDQIGVVTDIGIVIHAHIIKFTALPYFVGIAKVAV